MMVSSPGDRQAASPRSSLAAPVPPASAVTRTVSGSALGGFAQCPERATAPPRVETHAGTAGQRGGQRDLGYGDEAEADPHAIETLGSRVDGGAAERRRVIHR